MTHVIRAVLPLTFGLAMAAPAQAITFATGQGTDGAGCGAVASPCRTLQQAVTNTAAGGYVVLQGPADFGPAPMIDKAISIVGENGATIRANNIGPIVIGGPGDISKIVVRLRGMTIEGAGVGRTGVTWIGGARLEVADCVIRGFSDEGIFAQPYLPLNSSYKSFVSVLDSVIENAGTGIWVRKAANIGISAYVDGLRAQRNRIGVRVTHEGGDDAARAVVTNSAATWNAASGFSAYMLGASCPIGCPPPLGAGLFVVKSVASGNASGVLSGASADNVDGLVALSRSVLTGNASANGGTKLTHSYGGNVIRGNADDTLGRFSSQPLH